MRAAPFLASNTTSNAAAIAKSTVNESDLTASLFTSTEDIHTPLRISAIHATQGPNAKNGSAGHSEHSLPQRLSKTDLLI